MKKNIFYCFIFILVIFTSCSRRCEKGSDQLATEKRTVGTFSGIELDIPGKVVIRKGNDDNIILEGDDNLLPQIRTFVSEGKLFISTDNKVCLNPKRGIIVYVSIALAKSLNINGSGQIESLDSLSATSIALNINGSGNIRLGLNAKQINAQINGSGNIVLWGVGESSYFGISGSGTINAFNLLSRDVKVNIDGSGDAQVNVQENLSIDIGGSGGVRYKGSPKSIITNISGSGRVIKEG